MLFYFLQQFPSPSCLGGKEKKSRVEQAFVFHICSLARGILKQICVTYVMYAVDNHKDEEKIVVRMKILRWNYILI